MQRRLKSWWGVGVTAFALVACGTGEGRPDGSVQVTEVKSEFRTQSGVYVACNTVTQASGAVSTQTGFSVSFSTTDAVKTATVALKGQPTSQYDAFYVQTATPSQLSVGADHTYRLLLSANATSAVYLSQPSHVQTLTVRPPSQVLKVKVVRATNRQAFSFYPQVTVSSAGTSESDRSALAFPVYDTCTVLPTAISDKL